MSIPTPGSTEQHSQARQQQMCPVCHATSFRAFLDIPSVPVHCNLLWSTREGALGAPQGRIDLGFCPQCGHVWNMAFDPALMEYTQQYENSLHFSPRFQQYAEELAQRLIEQHTIRNKDIVEIGSGKGEFLRMLCEMGNNRGFGFDPSYIPEPEDEASNGKITFIQDLYSERYADYKADFICCRHVLEHIQFPADMLLNVRKTIGSRQDIVVFFEMPNALFMLRDLSIWDFIYEHCSYFSAGSLAYAFRDCGFDVLDLREEFGGQYLSITTLPAANELDTQQQAWEGLEAMAEQVAAMGSYYHQKVAEWSQRLAEMQQAGKKVVIWGVGSKGVTFLNILQCQDKIQYAVDINPRKVGMYAAGSGQEIVAPDFLRAYQPDAIILMNPIYQDEIRQTITQLGVNAELLPV